MKIGLQNFQGVGAYTEIPIAPITLFYGPNSAGKSTIADAFDFLSGALSGDNKNWRVDLVRHARRTRKTRPLKGMHLGKAEDIVFLVSCKGDQHSYSDWLNSHQMKIGEFLAQQTGIRDAFFEARSSIFETGEMDYWLRVPEFQLQLIFSCEDESDEVFIRESQWIINDIPLLKLISNGFNNLSIALNQSHPIYLVLDKQWPSGLRAELENLFSNQCTEESSDTEKWLMITGTCKYEEFSVEPVHWESFLIPKKDNKNTKKSHESQFALFNFLEWLLVMPVRSVGAATKIYTIPPIRSVPRRNEPIVLEEDEDQFRLVYYRGELNAWKILADEIRRRNLGYDSELFADEEGDEQNKLPANVLSFVNHVLSSTDYLNTGYVVSGDVKLSFDVGIEELNEIFELDNEEKIERLVSSHPET